MTSLIIGITSAIIIIIAISLLKQIDKIIVYGLALTGIGFLYVGFTWTDLTSLILNSFQAIVFLFLAYYGVKIRVTLIALGYFLHGCWDLAYDFIGNPNLIPPNYDLFCSSLDFTIGIYLLIFDYRVKSGQKEIVIQNVNFNSHNPTV